ncbi:hypothetical protein TRVL_05258 [Trypanosoma vivax]|nr:hypothetical protein TRVL_05258 [Trypanosoma vivax]
MVKTTQECSKESDVTQGNEVVERQCELFALRDNMETDSEGSYCPPTKHHKLSPEELQQLRNCTVEQIEEGDKMAKKGIDLFFANQVKDSEEILSKNAPLDPLYALGEGCLATLKAMLSMSAADAGTALEKLAYAVRFSYDVEHCTTMLTWKLRSFFQRSECKDVLPGVFRAQTIHAEALAIQGFLMILQRKRTTIMHGGICLLKCYNKLQKLMKQMDELKKKSGSDSYENIGLDRNTVHSLVLFFGCTNLVLYHLPPRIASIIKILGFTCDRELGVRLISMCWKSGAIFSPFAALFLLAFTTFIPGFCPVQVPEWLPVAKYVAETTARQSSLGNSLIYLWALGRIQRLERNVNESTATLSKCIEVAQGGQIAKFLPQLNGVAIYEQAWNFAAMGNWRDAIAMYKILEETSKWSKMFYTYAQGCCYDMLAIEECTNEALVQECIIKASQAYWRASHCVVKVVGGRAIAVEDFIAARACEMLSESNIKHPNPRNERITTVIDEPPDGKILSNPVPAPMLELLVLFDILHQVPHDLLKRMLETINKVIVGGSLSLLRDLPRPGVSSSSTRGHEKVDGFRDVIPSAVKAIILCRMENRKDEAIALLRKTTEAASVFKGTRCTATWVVPQLLYEEAMLALNDGDRERSAELLKRASASNTNRVLKMMMDTKLHFINTTCIEL